MNKKNLASWSVIAAILNHSTSGFVIPTDDGSKSYKRIKHNKFRRGRRKK